MVLIYIFFNHDCGRFIVRSKHEDAEAPRGFSLPQPVSPTAFDRLVLDYPAASRFLLPKSVPAWLAIRAIRAIARRSSYYVTIGTRYKPKLIISQGFFLKSCYPFFPRSLGRKALFIVCRYIRVTMSAEQAGVQREGRSSKSGRLRSACDACHQSKTKCSGGVTCVTCAMSNGQCTYSMGNRLGRPKGSKNKRILLQENRKNGWSETGDGGDRVPRRQRRQSLQRRSVSIDKTYQRIYPWMSIQIIHSVQSYSRCLMHSALKTKTIISWQQTQKTSIQPCFRR